jgi:hypothetical protein
MRLSVLAQSKSGATLRVILSNLQVPTMTLPIAKDIHNLVQNARRAELNGRMPMEVLYDLLLESNEWVFEVQFDSSRRLTHLFFASEKPLEYAAASPEVLFMDCTCKTVFHFSILLARKTTFESRFVS